MKNPNYFYSPDRGTIFKRGEGWQRSQPAKRNTYQDVFVKFFNEEGLTVDEMKALEEACKTRAGNPLND